MVERQVVERAELEPEQPVGHVEGRPRSCRRAAGRASPPPRRGRSSACAASRRSSASPRAPAAVDARRRAACLEHGRIGLGRARRLPDRSQQVAHRLGRAGHLGLQLVVRRSSDSPAAARARRAAPASRRRWRGCRSRRRSRRARPGPKAVSRRSRRGENCRNGTISDRLSVTTGPLAPALGPARPRGVDGRRRAAPPGRRQPSSTSRARRPAGSGRTACPARQPRLDLGHPRRAAPSSAAPRAGTSAGRASAPAPARPSDPAVAPLDQRSSIRANSARCQVISEAIGRQLRRKRRAAAPRAPGWRRCRRG
jgi:hypothetical protein